MTIQEILKVNTNIPVILAPMAGVTDLAFREICTQYGCDFTYSEMVSAKAISYNNQKTYKLMTLSQSNAPFGIQIFGHEQHLMADMAKKICDIYGDKISLIDINMGCPAPKIVNNGDGSALMKDILLASQIIENVSKASFLPVTVKFRKGWDNNTINAPEFAKMAEESGAAAITVHGRTREQFYSGTADWDIIAKIKQNVNIPVIANGDIKNLSSAKEIIEKTRCDAIMIGRGAQGNPFIFKEINAYYDNIPYTAPTDREKIETSIHHAILHEKYKTQAQFPEMRKHIAWYTSGMKGSGILRSRIFTCNSIDEIKNLLYDFLDKQENV